MVLGYQFITIGIVETRDHILFEWNRYNKTWQSPNNSIGSILSFLEGNPIAFCFDN